MGRLFPVRLALTQATYISSEAESFPIPESEPSHLYAIWTWQVKLKTSFHMYDEHENVYVQGSQKRWLLLMIKRVQTVTRWIQLTLLQHVRWEAGIQPVGESADSPDGVNYWWKTFLWTHTCFISVFSVIWIPLKHSMCKVRKAIKNSSLALWLCDHKGSEYVQTAESNWVPDIIKAFFAWEHSSFRGQHSYCCFSTAEV